MTPSFPPTNTALKDPDGLLAIGGDLHPDRLACAYHQGIFPWYSSGDPIMWWSPSQRAVLKPGQLRINRSTRKALNHCGFSLTSDQRFSDVIRLCAELRSGETWIDHDMIQAYNRLHEQGQAHSVEVHQNDQLVGGLYGVQVGGLFCGESMFHIQPNASKFAFISLSTTLFNKGFKLIDCQIQNDFLGAMGVKEIPRAEFETHLHLAQKQSTPWPNHWITPADKTD